MTIFVIAIIAISLLGIALLHYSNTGFEDRHGFAAGTGLFIAVVSLLGWVFVGVSGWNWKAAGVKVDILNREYGTHYTQAEFFYARDVIDTVRKLERKRIEVNGDLFREKSAEPGASDEGR